MKDERNRKTNRHECQMGKSWYFQRFFVGKVMQNPELCKELLQRILPELEIERIEYPEL